MYMVCIDPTKTLTKWKEYDTLGVGKKYKWLKNDKGCLIKITKDRLVTPETARKVYGSGVKGKCKFFGKCENGLANIDSCKEAGHFKCFNKGFPQEDEWEVLVMGCDEKGQASIITAVNKFKEQLHKGEITEDKYGDIINLIADTLQFGEIYEYPDADERKIYEELGIAHLIDEADAMEISVIKKDNKHGHESYGWGGGDKIILFNVSENGDNSIDVDGLEDALKVANLLCDAMNKEGI